MVFFIDNRTIRVFKDLILFIQKTIKLFIKILILRFTDEFGGKMFALFKDICKIFLYVSQVYTLLGKF